MSARDDGPWRRCRRGGWRQWCRCIKWWCYSSTGGGGGGRFSRQTRYATHNHHHKKEKKFQSAVRLIGFLFITHTHTYRGGLFINSPPTPPPPPLQVCAPVFFFFLEIVVHREKKRSFQCDLPRVCTRSLIPHSFDSTGTTITARISFDRHRLA